MAYKILIIDDEPEVCLSLKELLEDRGFSADYVTDPEEVEDRLREELFNLVLLDIRMPKLGGIDLLKLIKTVSPELPVIVISGHATVDIAVRAMKYGAVNLYTKPIDFKTLLSEINTVLSSRPKHRNNTHPEKIITQSWEMKKLIELVHKAAPTNASVLITGESGTGKELIANTLHMLSERKDKPYIRINCAAIPETLLESEIFGYEKGAFTDAKEQKKGLFEAADAGTLFLDEIGDMSLNTQAKMLRILQEKQFSRLGGTETINTDCRIITATNKEISSCIEGGTFREDLYYRLSVIHLHLPPLRKRREDILPLAGYFLAQYSAMYGKKIRTISPQVQEIILRHNWPGNIRELKNFIERSVIFSTGNEIDCSIIPEQYRFVGQETCEPDIAKQYQNTGREVIIEALKRSNWVKKDAAELLKINRKTLYNKMKKFNIE